MSEDLKGLFVFILLSTACVGTLMLDLIITSQRITS